MVSFGQGLFKKVEKKDEFGDVIGTKLQARAAGYFSNSATNNSKLFVSLVLDKREKETYDEWLKRYNSFGFIKEMTKGERKKYFKRYGKQYFERDNSLLGHIKIYLLEYGKNPAFINNDFIMISIKLADGTKLSFGKKVNRRIMITGYELGSEDYEPKESKVYNAITNSNDSIEFVIRTSINTVYKFKLNPPPSNS